MSKDKIKFVSKLHDNRQAEDDENHLNLKKRK